METKSDFPNLNNFEFFSKETIENLLIQINELTVLVQNKKMNYKEASNKLYHAQHDLQSMYWTLAQAISETNFKVRQIDKYNEGFINMICCNSNEKYREILDALEQYKRGELKFPELRRFIADTRFMLKDQFNATVTELADLLTKAKKFRNNRVVEQLNTFQVVDYNYVDDPHDDFAGMRVQIKS